MESKTREQAQLDYNQFFYANVCHVCKRQAHQKQHREQHKSLCNAVIKVGRTYSLKRCSETPAEWLTMKTDFMRLVSETLGRPLHTYERHMFTFLKECGICYERDERKLMECRTCVSSYCKFHIDSNHHEYICKDLGLCYRVYLHRINENRFAITDNFALVSNTNTFEMKDFIKTNIYIQTRTVMPYDILEAVYSPYVTCPLTLFHAMRLLDYVPANSKILVVHVVGPSTLEENTLAGWGVLLRLLKISSLIIVMVGPELKLEYYELPDWMLHENVCIFEFHKTLYEDYVRSTAFLKPDFVVGFNAHIDERNLGTPEETWASCIRIIANLKCPFVVTCRYTCEYLENEVERINTILNRKIHYKYKGKNPFACLQPIRVPLPQKVMYTNQYVIIYRSLCEKLNVIQRLMTNKLWTALTENMYHAGNEGHK
ncbi:PREDICTED: uncharacterized protein LOC105560501 isoform X2 [Vollenhovia emeryi]|uniref:uncharacterized protein LOC105560501 isoform X2 n=1 Tax=Vollenhovia emeryi TaxID=411798 RepID=UPI0005F3B5E6|nr:PREDICTED: uncharacterized protein LOC105560501 isoform X2 [Vollenhovia emeryi]